MKLSIRVCGRWRRELEPKAVYVKIHITTDDAWLLVQRIHISWLDRGKVKGHSLKQTLGVLEQQIGSHGLALSH
jgi:hypothetical protein